MDLHSAIGEERTLRQIMLRLVAFSALAERTALRSLPVRLIVLWILRHAEAAAAGFVFEAAGMPPSVQDIEATGNEPEDALRLARRFMALAAVLAGLLAALPAVACRLGSWPARRVLAFGRGARASGRPEGSWTAEPNDTS